MGSKRIATRLTKPRPRALPMPERERLPGHINMSLREFKKLKRQQALAVERALDELLIASAYMPAVDGVYLGRILDQIQTARREWRKWWKNA
jgi:hypothetical protein